MNAEKVFIIAEAGVNHNGSMENAFKLIDVAVAAGADAVKFQTFKAESLVQKNAPKAAYQQDSAIASESQFDMIKKLELDVNTHYELMEYCHKKRIMFLSTPFDFDSIELLDKLNIALFKVPSGEITNVPYLRKIGAKGKPVLLSTGMSTLGEIESALKILIDAGATREKITVLHANTMYPTPMEDANLRAIHTIACAFNVKAGYSDHTLGIEAPIAAVALGATVIEKHFTLDRGMSGPDHAASLEPHELKQMVETIRNIEMGLGDGIKCPTKSEWPNREVARKSIVAKTDIKKGELFSEGNLTVMRPGNGLGVEYWDETIGEKAQKNYRAGEQL